MFIRIHTIERGEIQINKNNIEDVFYQGDRVFIELISGKELELDTEKMSKDELLELL